MCLVYFSKPLAIRKALAGSNSALIMDKKYDESGKRGESGGMEAEK